LEKKKASPAFSGHNQKRKKPPPNDAQHYPQALKGAEDFLQQESMKKKDIDGSSSTIKATSRPA